MTARVAHIALLAGLIIAMSGLGRGTVVMGDDGCCEPGVDSGWTDRGWETNSSDGCPLPCSDCVCAASYLAPAIVAQFSVVLASAPEPAQQAVAPDVHPEARFLPGVFRPPRHAA